MGIIKTTEKETSLTTPAKVEAVLQCIIGRAPINLLQNPQSAVNKPLLINSFEEAVSKVGYSENFADYELNQATMMNFKNFAVAPLIYINVLDPSNENHITAVAASAKAIPTSKKINIDVEGILLSTIELSTTSGGTTTKYVADTDYVAAFDTNGKVVISILSTGALASASTVDVAFTKLKPSGVTASDIIGGYNALTAEASGIECIEKVFPMLGKVPSCLLAPGFSKNPTVMSALKAKAADINSVFKAIFICDADCSTVKTYDAVGTWKNTNSYTDKQMLLTWPAVKIGTDIFHSSIQLGARYASLVAGQIDGFPCDYPSNVDAGIQGACLEDGTEVNLDIKQANTLNEQGVCTFLNWEGWKNWGVYTAAYPGNRDVKDYFSAIRTIFTNWNNTFVLTHFNKIDKCMSRKRIDNILDTENIRVSAFTQNDLIADAHMEFEETQNPATNLLAGKIKFHQFLSCYPPMNEIENILEFDVEGLQNRLFGGN